MGSVVQRFIGLPRTGEGHGSSPAGALVEI